MKKSFKKRRTNKIMKGGKFLGEGSYGCVISPALSCKISSINKPNRNTKKRGNNNKTVSKIIATPDNQVNDEIKDEIVISNKLKSIDPQQKYFITINEHCKIKNIPRDRSNVVSVKYLNDSSSYYHKIEQKKLDKKYCPIDLSMQPLNLVMPYGGYDLVEIANIINRYGISKKLSNIDTQAKNKLMIGRMLFNNLKSCIKNLLTGLFKMHQNRIVNRDIKEENIITNYNQNTKQVNIRYIDYGLSEILTPEYCTHESNIDLRGTYELLSPEIFIIYNVKKYYRYDDNYIMSKINIDIQNYVKKQLKGLKINTTELKTVIPQLYDKIKKEFSNKTLLNNYFGVNDIFNGYLQKGDVYSLGITLYEFLYSYTDVINIKKDLRLYDLLQKMIDINPNNRYNVLQCLHHPYFK